VAGVLDFLDLLVDVFTFGDWLDGIAAGDAAERGSQFYDAPQMRQLRWIARAVLLVYVAAIAAIPILAATWRPSDLWLSLASDGVVVTLIVLYVVAVCVGFVLLRRLFRRKRQSIVARLAAAEPG
jgi:hypothetical protein